MRVNTPRRFYFLSSVFGHHIASRGRSLFNNDMFFQSSVFGQLKPAEVILKPNLCDSKLLLDGNVGSSCIVLREDVAQQLAGLLTLDMRVFFVWGDVDVLAAFVGSPHRDPMPSTLGFAK